MNLSADFEQRTRALLGDERYEKLRTALNTEPSVSVRLNPFKAKNMGINERFYPKNVAWCNTGYYLCERANFTFDPLFHAGCYYVQEASSMFIHTVAKQYITSAVQALDLCAAPGGKTSAIRAVLPHGSLLFANEPMRNRAQILAENMQKFGHPDVVVTNNYAKNYQQAGLSFDAIIADVPCSGEGMFRKDEDARLGWSASLVHQCASLQREIITDIWPCLKENGLLIYSTCTFNAQENEENVEWIMNHLGAECLEVNVDSAWNIEPSLNSEIIAYRFMQGYTQGEGLFMCVLRKTSNDTVTPKKMKKKGAEPVSLKWNKQWLQQQDSFFITQQDDTVRAIPKQWLQQYILASNHLKLMYAGIILGVCKGKDVIPSHALALSICIHQQMCPKENLSYEQAIAYLRKETIVLSPETPKGIVLVCFNHVPIGFVKNLGNRANNLYPTEWKIKSSHIPPHDGGVLKQL